MVTVVFFNPDGSTAAITQYSEVEANKRDLRQQADFRFNDYGVDSLRDILLCCHGVFHRGSFNNCEVAVGVPGAWGSRYGITETQDDGDTAINLNFLSGFRRY